MKAIVYDAKDKIFVQEKPEPQPKSGEILVNIKWAGICGSDMVAWNGGFARIKEPVILGHELTGEIVQIADDEDKKKFKVGQRVVVEPILACGQCEACRKGNYNVCRNLKVIGLDSDGGFASYVSVPTIRVHKLPDTISYDRAALCEPVAVAVHMVRRTKLKVGDTVAVLGAGPIGLLVAMVARESGASKIILSDINPFRLKLTEELGFKTINGKDAGRDEILDYVGDEGADVTFELAAQESTLKLATEITKISGTILAGGIFKNPPKVTMQELTLKEHNFIGSRMYTFSDYEAAINLLEKDNFNVEKLITKKLSIDEAIPKGFEAIKNGEDVMKVLIKMD